MLDSTTPNLEEAFFSSDGSRSGERALREKHTTLPPTDGGIRAWLFLCGSCMVEGLLFEFPLTLGVFQEHYAQDSRFGPSPYLPLIGTFAIGISKLCSPLITAVIIKYPNCRTYLIWVGSIICVAALLASSFSTRLWHLIFTQGFLYSIGFLILYYPMLSMLNEWFHKRRGFAYGVLFGAGGIFGLALPLILQQLLNRFGQAVTLRVYAITIVVIIGPCLPLLRGRLPYGTVVADRAKLDTTVFSKVTFSTMTFSNIFQGLSSFLPILLIPSYAAAIGLTTSQGTSIISANNVAVVIGCATLGYFVDRADFHPFMFSSCLLCCVMSLLLWGYSTSFPALFSFGILWGFLADPYSVLFSRWSTALTDQPDTQVLLYSVFEAQRGAATILGGFFSGILVTGKVEPNSYAIGSYEPLIFMVGVSMWVACLGGLGWYVRDKRFKFACPVRITSLVVQHSPVRERSLRPANFDC